MTELGQSKICIVIISKAADVIEGHVADQDVNNGEIRFGNVILGLKPIYGAEGM